MLDYLFNIFIRGIMWLRLGDNYERKFDEKFNISGAHK